VTNYRTRRFYRDRDRQRLGSSGAASEVRHIDPATYQLPDTDTEVSKRPAVSEKTALANKADNLLRSDARRRFGKQAGDRARLKIKAGRYSA
jgi:hypothetical protein